MSDKKQGRDEAGMWLEPIGVVRNELKKPDLLV